MKQESVDSKLRACQCGGSCGLFFKYIARPGSARRKFAENCPVVKARTLAQEKIAKSRLREKRKKSGVQKLLDKKKNTAAKIRRMSKR